MLTFLAKYFSYKNIRDPVINPPICPQCETLSCDINVETISIKNNDIIIYLAFIPIGKKSILSLTFGIRSPNKDNIPKTDPDAPTSGSSLPTIIVCNTAENTPQVR